MEKNYAPTVVMPKTLTWLVATLTSVGGGEKLLNEGVRYYRSIGYDVHVLTGRFDPIALFDGRYESRDIHVLTDSIKTTDRTAIHSHAWSRLKSVFKLIKLVKKLKPKLMLCQSEYDVILLALVSLFTRTPYSILVFGQTFQFPKDFAKYSLIFRRHLKDIRNSMPGYVSTVPLESPKTSLLNRLANELICLVRFFAVKAARVRIVFSKQVQWEVEKLYAAQSVILKGAFPRQILSYESDIVSTRTRYGIEPHQKVFLVLNRLEIKKRTDLALQAFALLQDPSALLLIGGRGPELEKLRDLSRELSIESRVRFLGYVQETDVWPLKQMCDVFLSLDIADFDISPLEASALGRKVVWTSEIDMDSTMLQSKNIHIAEPTAEAVSRVMEEAWKAPTHPTRALFGAYTWENYFDSVLKVSGID